MSLSDVEAKNKKWFWMVIGITVIFLTILGSITVLIDPFFHFHKPLAGLSYPLDGGHQRYLNDGIVKNFEYNAVITGTSMTENFKTTDCDAIFNVSSIKIPLFASTYKETNDILKKAFTSGNEIKVVIRCLDYSRLITEKDAVHYDASFYPTYLYDNNPLNDTSYIFNKTILLNDTYAVIHNTLSHISSTTFDEYSYWSEDQAYGAAAVLNTYTIAAHSGEARGLSENEIAMVQENIRQNVTSLAKEHPETTFYCFFPPYSICYWDALIADGQFEQHLDAEKYAIEEMLPCENLKLYSFCTDYEMVCNLDNYMDTTHYGGWINQWMLSQMHDGQFLLTKDNYLNYLEDIRNFYSSYDYESLHRGKS